MKNFPFHVKRPPGILIEAVVKPALILQIAKSAFCLALADIDFAHPDQEKIPEMRCKVYPGGLLTVIDGNRDLGLTCLAGGLNCKDAVTVFKGDLVFSTRGSASFSTISPAETETVVKPDSGTIRPSLSRRETITVIRDVPSAGNLSLVCLDQNSLRSAGNRHGHFFRSSGNAERITKLSPENVLFAFA